VTRLGIRGTVVEDRQPFDSNSWASCLLSLAGSGPKASRPVYMLSLRPKVCLRNMDQPAKILDIAFGSASCRAARTIQAKGLANGHVVCRNESSNRKDTP